MEHNEDPEIQKLLEEIRDDLDLRGWRTEVRRRSGRVSLEFANPLSPMILTVGLGPEPVTAEERLRAVRYLAEEPEFVALRSRRPPRRKSRLVGGIRGGAASYGWSRETLEQVTDLLHEVHLLSREEADWIQAVDLPKIPGAAMEGGLEKP